MKTAEPMTWKQFSRGLALSGLVGCAAALIVVVPWAVVDYVYRRFA